MNAEMPEGEEKPPRGVRTMAIVRWAILAFAAAVAIFVWAAYALEKMRAPTDITSTARTYTCPMHPQIVSNEPGECPICHMDLVPVTTTSTPDAAADAMSPPGTGAITLSLDRIQAIGVRIAPVEEGPASAALRVTASVQPPEQGTAEVHVRTPGFVEAVHVDQTGKPVATGQPMLALYSPEIFQAQQELLAMRAWNVDAGPNASRTKLELLGMSAAEIDRVTTKKEVVRAIAVVAPRGGYVTKKNVVLGSYVTPDMVLYEIQDLSRVYVIADVFLRDLPHVAIGAEARFVPTGGREARTGKIDLVYPLVLPDSRTRRVRMQLPNAPASPLTPGEYGLLEITTASRHTITIPRDALVDTGASTYVFVAEGEGRFVPRTVVPGGTDGERIIIADGLSPGERVVSGATFLVDSESRLSAPKGAR